MNRITQRDLDGVIKRVNQLTGNPETSYTKTIQEDGRTKYTANIGNYHLDCAYGGVKMVQMVSEGGGIRDILYTGYTTKRDLYNRIHAYISGIESTDKEV